MIVDNQPHKCIRYSHGGKGRAGGFILATIKNIMNGNQFEKKYLSDDLVEHVELENVHVSYSWADNDNLMFMNAETFEEIVVPKKEVANADLLISGIEVKLKYFRETIIGAELPLLVEYLVTDRPIDLINASGDLTLNQPTALEGCDGIILSPESVKVGSRIKVNTVDRVYHSTVH